MENREGTKVIDLIEYWNVIVKRKWMVLGFAGALIFLTSIYSFMVTPLYESKLTLLIEDESSRMLSIDETFGTRPPLLQDLRTHNTQIGLLLSRSLADRVARKMNLISRPEFGAVRNPKKGLAASIKYILTLKWLFPRSPAPENSTGTPIPSNPYSVIVTRILRNMKVTPLRDTKLVEVGFVSSSPDLAAEILDVLAKEFISFSIEKRFSSTQQASDFLSEQISNVREDLAAKENELQRYGQEKDLYFLTNNESTTVNRFADMNQAYSQAIIDRIRAETAFREIRDLDVESIPQFVNNPVVMELRADYTRTKNEYEERSKVFKPDYPDMISLKARLDSIKAELMKAVRTAEVEYQSALKRENSLKNMLDQQRNDVTKMNSNAILYNSIRIEVQTLRDLLNSLVRRQNETLVSARLGGINTNSISIIDEPEVPRIPFKPNRPYNLIMALLIGLFGGVAFCFLLEYMDNTVKGPEDVEKLTGLPSLGIIPFVSSKGMDQQKGAGYTLEYSYASSSDEKNHNGDKPLPDIKKIELVNYLFPKHPISDYYRTIRTSILLSHAENPPKAIAVTSSVPQEGKTSMVANLAVAFSQLQEKVLIVEADMRRPRLHQLFNLRRTSGLSSYLTGNILLKETIQKTSVENIWAMPCGPIAPNPAELLNSKKMKDMIEELKGIFDIIFLDTPPVLAVIDPIIVSSQADCALFVIRSGKTVRRQFIDAVGELRKVNIKIIGVVFNEVFFQKQKYYYRGYYHPYGSEHHG